MIVTFPMLDGLSIMEADTGNSIRPHNHRQAMKKYRQYKTIEYENSLWYWELRRILLPFQKNILYNNETVSCCGF